MYDVHDHANVSTNYTAMGSEIQLFCGNQTNEESASPAFTAVCGGNGTWSPDLSGHIKCTTNQDSNDSEFSIALWFAQTCIVLCPNACDARNFLELTYKHIVDMM